MGLLPLNAKIQDQKFAHLLDLQTIEDYSCLNTDPLVCHSSLLVHIAAGLNVDISQMSEKQARLYLKKIQKGRNIAGSVQAVEDAIDIFLGEGKLVEWFDDDRLSRGQFMVITQQDEVKSFLQNIKYFKNVRSKLVTVSDNMCSNRARLDYTCYDESILSDNDGVLINGVRVCFKKSSFKTILVNAPVFSKSIESITNSKLTVSLQALIKNKIIERYKDAIIARGWVGKWEGTWNDRYIVSVRKVSIGD